MNFVAMIVQSKDFFVIDLVCFFVVFIIFSDFVNI